MIMALRGEEILDVLMSQLRTRGGDVQYRMNISFSLTRKNSLSIFPDLILEQVVCSSICFDTF